MILSNSPGLGSRGILTDWATHTAPVAERALALRHPRESPSPRDSPSPTASQPHDRQMGVSPAHLHSHPHEELSTTPSPMAPHRLCSPPPPEPPAHHPALPGHIPKPSPYASSPRSLPSPLFSLTAQPFCIAFPPIPLSPKFTSAFHPLLLVPVISSHNNIPPHPP